MDQAVDGSSSAISEAEALIVAKATVAKHEHWPEHQPDLGHLVHSVYYEGHRTNNGGWVVIAHRGFYSTDPHEAPGSFLFDAVPAAIIAINKVGTVNSYSRQWSIDDPPRRRGVALTL